jgi:hypothetical protein
MEYLCSYCNKPFVPKRTDSLYCSHSCRQFAYVLRKSSKELIKNFPVVKSIPLLDEISEEQTEQPIGQGEDQSKRNDTKSVINENKLSVLTENKLSVKTDNKLPVRTEEKKEFPTPPVVKKTEANDNINYQSRSVVQLDKLYGERDLWYSLSKFFDSKDEAGVWVSERYRCLVEVLLTFSEMKRVELDDLKEVCNSFTDVIRSKYFKDLHPSYAYIDEIVQLRERLKVTCVKSNGGFIKYRLSKEQKQTLIVTRFELSQFVAKRKFNELKFRDNQLYRKDES